MRLAQTGSRRGLLARALAVAAVSIVSPRLRPALAEESVQPAVIAAAPAPPPIAAPPIAAPPTASADTDTAQPAAPAPPPVAAPAAPPVVQRGADRIADTAQKFDDSLICVRRTPLGACAEVEPRAKTAAAAASGSGYRQLPTITSTKIESDGLPTSEYIRGLRERTAQNQDVNAREVLEKTIKASLPGSYGPLAKTAPVMRADGSFEDVKLALFDQLKDAGKLTQTRTGLDTFVKGFDPDRPLQEQVPKSKLFGLF